MATLFVSQPGQVAVVNGDVPVPATLLLENWDGFPAIYAALTGVVFTTKGGVHLRPTLGDWISVLVFREDPGTVVINGIAFTGSCDTAGTATGVDQLLAYYDAQRATRTGQPIAVHIGTQEASRVRGFLSGIEIASSNPEMQLTQFRMFFQTLPSG